MGSINVQPVQRRSSAAGDALVSQLINLLFREQKEAPAPKEDKAGNALTGLEEFMRSKEPMEVQTPAAGRRPVPMQDAEVSLPKEASPLQTLLAPEPEAEGNQFMELRNILDTQERTPIAPESQWEKTTAMPQPQRYPKGQSEDVYEALAKKELGLGSGERPAIQMVQGAGGEYTGIEKKAGPSGVFASSNMQSKPAVRRDEAGKEMGVFYAWNNPKDPSAPTIWGEEVRDPIDVQKARATAMADARASVTPVAAIDTRTNTFGYRSQKDLTSAPFGQYAQAGPYVTAAKARSFTEAIRADVEAARQIVNRMPNFSPVDAAVLEEYMGNPDNPKDYGSVQAALRSAVGHTLSKDQLLYVVRINSLIETSMSLRVIQGQGAGAEDQRRAIRLMLPNGTSVSREFANEMLNSVETTIAGVEMGIMNANLNPPTLLTDDNGLVPSGETNKMWSSISQQLNSRGYFFDPDTRMWKKQGTSQGPGTFNVTGNAINAGENRTTPRSGRTASPQPQGSGGVVKWRRDASGKLRKVVE